MISAGFLPEGVARVSFTVPFVSMMITEKVFAAMAYPPFAFVVCFICQAYFLAEHETR